MKILIVEDEPLIAEDISESLKKSEFEITDIAYTKKDAFTQLETNLPDMVLLDINLDNKMDGIEIAEIIKDKYQIPFIFITSYSDKSTLEKAKITEPAGYLVKPFNEAGLSSSIEIAFYNHIQKTKRNFPEINLAKLNKNIQEQVTEREFDLLKLIYEGKTNKQIAETLFISPNTVKKHINNAYLKLDVSSRSTALVKLRELMML